MFCSTKCVDRTERVMRSEDCFSLEFSVHFCHVLLPCAKSEDPQDDTPTPEVIVVFKKVHMSCA